MSITDHRGKEQEQLRADHGEDLPTLMSGILAIVFEHIVFGFFDDGEEGV